MYKTLKIISILLLCEVGTLFADTSNKRINHKLYNELYFFLVKAGSMELQSNSLTAEDIVDIDTTFIEGLILPLDFYVFRFKSKTSSGNYIFTLIKFKDVYKVYKSWDMGGIMEELIFIQSKYHPFNDNLYIEIIKRIQYPKKRLIEEIGFFNYIYDM